MGSGMRKKKLILISSILKVIIALCIIITIVAIVTEGSNKSVFGYSMFIIKTGSMHGTMEIGELIITKKPNKEQLHVGSVISFISSDPEILGKVNTHRIISIKGDQYYTQGDAPGAPPDETPVKYGDILGVLAWKSMAAGRVVTWLEQPLHMFLCLILPTVLVFYFEGTNGRKKLARIFRRNKKKKSADEMEREILKSLLLTAPAPLTAAQNETSADDAFSALSREMYIDKLADELYRQLSN